jgi:hypothetical protein
MKDTIDTTESRAAKTILEQEETVTVGGETYGVSPPSIATLILVSEAVSQLPAVNADSDDLLSESLRIAKDCRALGDITAILILGAKRLAETVKTVRKRFMGLVREETETVVDRRSALAKKLLEDASPRELHGMLVQLLKTMQLSDFFGLTASLAGINLLRKTGEAGTTASGQS